MYSVSSLLGRLRSTNLSLDRKRVEFEGARSDIYPNVTLLRNGHLGTSPILPSVAISIRTLADYCQVHHVCPRFSIEAQVRRLCHLHKVQDQFMFLLSVF